MRVPVRLSLCVNVGGSVPLGVRLCESGALCDTESVWVTLVVDENVAVMVNVNELVFDTISGWSGVNEGLGVTVALALCVNEDASGWVVLREWFAEKLCEKVTV